MSSPITYDIQGSVILIRPGPDAPAQIYELCKGAPCKWTEKGPQFMLPVSMAGQLRAAMQDRQAIDNRIAAPPPRPEWREPPDISLYSHQAGGIQFLIDRKSALLADDMGLGKGVCYNTPMLTPTGWKPIENVSVGDTLIDPDGGHAKVTGVYPQPKQPVYKITFSDGCSVTTDGPHRWLVLTPNDRTRGGAGRVMTTEELIKAGLRTKPSPRGDTARKWFIPVMQPAEFEQTRGFRPFHPYLLGVLLGNGSFRGHAVVLTDGNDETITKASVLWSMRVRKSTEQDKSPTYVLLGAMPAMRLLGLAGKLSPEKFVPPQYIHASVDDRYGLLRGLMDTDGNCTRGGVAVFNTSSPHLRDAVVEIVRSLGGIATVSEKRAPKYVHNNEVRTGQTAWRVNVRTPLNPFTLSRKAERWKKPILARGIESIEPAGEAKTICVSVDSKRNLFVTKDYIVTHNTLQSIFAAEFARIGGKVLVVCPAGLIGNWLSELEKWAPNVTARIQMNRDFDLDCDYSIVSYDTGKIEGDLREALLAETWSVLIMDESQWVKGVHSQRHQFIMLLQALHRWQLTGTPMLNRPADLLGLLRAGGHPLGQDPEEFERRFVADDRDSLNISQTLGLELSAWIMRRYKSDVLDLPEKQHIQQGVATANYIPGSIQELMRNRNALAQAKVQATLDTVRSALDSSDRGVIVFSCFRKPLDMLEEALKDQVPYARIDGSVSGKKRQRIVEAFQAGKTRVLLGQIVAAGVGLTLTKATTVIFNDLSYIPADHAQAEDRAHRISQDSNVTIYYMLGRCPLDEVLWELLEVKKKNIGKFEEGLRSRRDVEVSPEELLEAIRNRQRQVAAQPKGASACSSAKQQFEITSWPKVSRY